MVYTIIIGLWVIGTIIAYHFIKNWNKNKFEKIWFSIVWPVLAPLYIIHWLYNKF